VPDAPGAGVDEDSLTFLEMSGVKQRLPRGEAASGTAAASANDALVGFIAASSSRTMAYSAYPPPR
jgi:hypothetical protein